MVDTERDSTKNRPLGVTIVAILAIIGGIFFIIGGLAPLAIAAIVPEFSVLLIGIGSILIAIGIGYLVVSYGLMKAKGWAWSITLVLSYVGIVFGIISIIGGNFLSIIHLIISIVIIWYLYKSQIKSFFGKPATARI
jgi:uncharacterized membrane protein (DUF2068 family)